MTLEGRDNKKINYNNKIVDFLGIKQLYNRNKIN